MGGVEILLPMVDVLDGGEDFLCCKACNAPEVTVTHCAGCGSMPEMCRACGGIESCCSAFLDSVKNVTPSGFARNEIKEKEEHLEDHEVPSVILKWPS